MVLGLNPVSSKTVWSVVTTDVSPLVVRLISNSMKYGKDSVHEMVMVEVVVLAFMLVIDTTKLVAKGLR